MDQRLRERHACCTTDEEQTRYDGAHKHNQSIRVTGQAGLNNEAHNHNQRSNARNEGAKKAGQRPTLSASSEAADSWIGRSGRERMTNRGRSRFQRVGTQFLFVQRAEIHLRD